MSADDLARFRKDESTACRSRVEEALARLQAAGAPISPGAVAAAAGVHRSFLYRPSHQDLLAAVKRAQATPPAVRAGGRVSDAGLRAENGNLRSQNQRLTERLRVLERRLGEALGTAIHTEAGLGSGGTAEQVQRRLQQAEEQVRTLRRELEEREDELRAARAANRELLTALNVGR